MHRPYVNAVERALPHGEVVFYVKFSKAKVEDELTITYPLVEFTQEVGIWPERPDLVFRVYWRGNTVTQMDPRGKHMPMFVKPGP